LASLNDLEKQLELLQLQKEFNSLGGDSTQAEAPTLAPDVSRETQDINTQRLLRQQFPASASLAGDAPLLVPQSPFAPESAVPSTTARQAPIQDFTDRGQQITPTGRQDEGGTFFNVREDSPGFGAAFSSALGAAAERASTRDIGGLARSLTLPFGVAQEFAKQGKSPIEFAGPGGKLADELVSALTNPLGSAALIGAEGGSLIPSQEDIGKKVPGSEGLVGDIAGLAGFIIGKIPEYLATGGLVSGITNPALRLAVQGAIEGAGEAGGEIGKVARGELTAAEAAPIIAASVLAGAVLNPALSKAGRSSVKSIVRGETQKTFEAAQKIEKISRDFKPKPKKTADVLESVRSEPAGTRPRTQKLDIDLTPFPKDAPPSTVRKVAASNAEKVTTQQLVEAKAVGKGPTSKPKPSSVEANPEVSLLNKSTDTKLRESLRAKNAAPFQKRSHEEALEIAKKTGAVENAEKNADEIIKSPRSITDIEQVALKARNAELEIDIDRSAREALKLSEAGNVKGEAIERARLADLEHRRARLVEADDIVGTLEGRAFGARKVALDRETLTVAKTLAKTRDIKGSKLTAAEENFLTSSVIREQKLTPEIQALIKKEVQRADIAERRLAELQFSREVKSGRITSRAKGSFERIRAEQGDILKQLGALGFRANDIIGVTLEGSFLIGRLAKTYIQLGAITLDEVIRKVLNDIPNIEEKDIIRSLNQRNPKLQKKAKSAAQQREAVLKSQAGLITKIDDALNGITVTASKAKVEAGVRALRRALSRLRPQLRSSELRGNELERALQVVAELETQLKNEFRNIPKGKRIVPAELAQVNSQIKELKQVMRLNDQMAIIKEQFRLNDFGPPKDALPKAPTSPEIQRKQIKLLSMRKERAQFQRQTAKTKFRQIVSAFVNTPRTLLSTADVSSVLRQGFFLSARRPIKASKNFVRSVKAMFNENTALEIENEITSAPHHYIRQKAKLFIAERGSDLNKAEENFLARYLGKIPGLGSVVKGSERQFVTFLNLMRVEAFDGFLQRFPNATQKELSAWASFVNVASGRGSLSGRVVGKEVNFEGAADLLSSVFFAPRFAISRIQTPLKIFGRSADGTTTRVRKEIIKDMVAAVSVGNAALQLAELAGADVSFDPSSSDFGKAVIGNTGFDPWAGTQQPFRVITQLLGRGGERLGLKEAQKIAFGHGSVDLLTRFAEFKISPHVALFFELLDEKDLLGRPITPTQAIAGKVVPLSLQEMTDAILDADSAPLTLVALASQLGISVSTFPRNKKTPQLRTK